MMIDETLLEPRAVRRSIDCEDGLGYDVELSCGHSVWFAIQPPDRTVCGVCLEHLIAQIRQVQAHQEPRYTTR